MNGCTYSTTTGKEASSHNDQEPPLLFVLLLTLQRLGLEGWDTYLHTTLRLHCTEVRDPRRLVVTVARKLCPDGVSLQTNFRRLDAMPLVYVNGSQWRVFHSCYVSLPLQSSPVPTCSLLPREPEDQHARPVFSIRQRSHFRLQYSVYQYLRHSPGVYKLVRALLASHNRRYHAPLSTVIPSRQSNILKLTQDCFSEHVRMITCIFSIHLRNFLMYLPLHPAYSLSLASCGLHCVLYMSCTCW